MAGDWIKMRVDLDSDPAVIRMARKLGVGETTIVGCLHNIWSWADKQTVDGCVDGIASTWLDRRVYLPDFAAAMIEVGWLEELPNGAGIRFPKFGKHNGETAKNRASKSETQAKWRAKKAAKDVDSFVDGGVSTPPPTREEKRRVNTSSAETLRFTAEGGWENLQSKDVDLWKQAYPAIDVEAELAKAAAWLRANPKNKKSNYARFLNGWFTRAQDRAPRQAVSTASVMAGAI